MEDEFRKQCNVCILLFKGTMLFLLCLAKINHLYPKKCSSREKAENIFKLRNQILMQPFLEMQFNFWIAMFLDTERILVSDVRILNK